MINCKGCGRKRSWPNFKALSRDSSGGTEETTTNLSQGSRSRGRDLNPGLPEYEAGALNHGVPLQCYFIRYTFISV
jgi:hypothetical protein